MGAAHARSLALGPADADADANADEPILAGPPLVGSHSGPETRSSATPESEPGLEIQSELTGQVVRLCLAGRFDASAVDEFRFVVEGLLATPGRQVEADLSEVTFLDGLGLHELMRASARAGEQAGTFFVTQLSPATQIVREVSGLTKIVRTV